MIVTSASPVTLSAPPWPGLVAVALCVKASPVIATVPDTNSSAPPARFDLLPPKSLSVIVSAPALSVIVDP